MYTPEYDEEEQFPDYYSVPRCECLLCQEYYNSR